MDGAIHEGRFVANQVAKARGLAHDLARARDAYAALTQPEQYDLRLYLATLTRARARLRIVSVHRLEIGADAVTLAGDLGATPAR